MSSSAFPPPAASATIGWIDEPCDESVVGPQVRVRGWALAAAGIRAVELRFGADVFRATYGLPREDVAAVRPGYPDNPNGGFVLDADLSRYACAPGVERRTMTIVAIAHDGTETSLGERSLIEASAHERWRFLASEAAPHFHVLPALSGVAAGGAFGLAGRYAAYASSTIRVGMRVPILYLRTTTGAADDYRFDAEFDVTRREGARAVADDSLAHVLAHAAANDLPVLVTLNGGIWADAGGTCPRWDVNDRLEEDVANCQWNERDEVMPDGWLTHLPGSQHAPELARALTLNVYARTVRDYKRRNLCDAARRVADFMRAHPALLVGVNLDPDVYINPFFAETQWYDYNPGTLAQFRHWLAGTGPYEGATNDGVPDLTRHRREAPLSLSEVGAIAGRAFRRWDDVDPPRAFPRDEAKPYWRDPWVREWEHFRRHLVALHYEELAEWIVGAGIPGERIWSSQGLMAPGENCMPLALSITSPVKDHDSGGVSIEGSKPRHGHLGAIVYGAAATNDIVMENGRSLFATLAAIDDGFAIVEFNTADLRRPDLRPTYAQAYRALRELWNSGARFVSPMAWNGSNGVHADRPDYVSFTAWRNTPLEEATRDFMLARSGLPRGSRLWTFGSQQHADDDGWHVETGTMRALRGAVALAPGADGRTAVVSPAGIARVREAIDAIVIGFDDPSVVEAIRVETRAAPDARWLRCADAPGATLERTRAGIILRWTGTGPGAKVDQLRITLALTAGAIVRRIAILRTP